MNNYQYNDLTFKNAIKSHVNNIYNTTYYVEGYCDMKQGRVFFKGDVGGVSESQARFYIIYMLRDKYGEDVWINPIFYKISKCEINKNIKDRKLIFDLKKYEDDKCRYFVPFNQYEANEMKKVKNSQGHLMPKIIEMPLYNLGISSNNTETSYIRNNLITSDINWDRKYLLSEIKNTPNNYYYNLNNKQLTSTLSNILKNKDIQSKLLKVLDMPLFDYNIDTEELIKINNIIYDIKDLTDILHHSKLISELSKKNKSNTVYTFTNLQNNINTINFIYNKTKNEINNFKRCTNLNYEGINILEHLRDFYIQILNNLNEAYYYTYDLKAFYYTMSNLCEILLLNISLIDDFSELEGYTYNNNYADKLRNLNKTLFTSIIIKIRLIITELMYASISLHNMNLLL